MSLINEKLKTPGIPLWATLFLCLIVVLGFVMGLMALTGNGALESHNISWGGRQIGLAAVALIAIWLRNTAVYFAAFIGAAFKEFSDMLELFATGTADTMGVGFLVVFILAELVGAFFSFRAIE